ncbi:NAD(P)-binding protein [Radiomyces spectabilis]|uniref:NAD(P)-binding protein n=1 Tax=Radiomyces spectabilis TaxID=64574 RepID=UPI002220F927|nr:NAD(P)-binding protein [Radiomyces spectabilis]KAI8369615.1 NAD(P)-binding protein [Radiomyces spectabilis]
MGKTAIVFGANGISGTALIERLTSASKEEWSQIVAVSRRPPQIDHEDQRVRFVSCDLLNGTIPEMAKSLVEAGAGNAQHAFFYAYIMKQDPKEESKINTELLHRALQLCENACPGLQTFMLQTGMKGPPAMSSLPFREDAPRPEGENFYYPQEDLVKQFSKEHNWRWIITRPNIIAGVSRGNYMNMAVSLGIYAVLQKELGREFKFPGNKFAWQNIVDQSAAVNNADFQIWASTNPKAADNIFNITNGDKITISELWHKIADYFGLKVPKDEDQFKKCDKKEGRCAEFSLKDYMYENEDNWKKLAQKYNLDPKAIEYCTWDFVDQTFERTWPDDSTIEKARSLGWDKKLDSAKEFYNAFDKMKQLNMLPSN